MKKKIQRSMMIILLITFVLFYAILALILYNRNLNVLQGEVRQEARYIQTAVNMSGTGYLEQLDEVDKGTRITLVSEDGDVLYDTDENGGDMENHASRQEVAEAFRTGQGEDVRMSDTLGEEFYYYALLLDDGCVLRVAKTMDGLARTALNVLPVMGILAVVMVIFAMLLAGWQTKRLIRPINELDLEHPLDNAVYEELTPLLVAMDRQNKEKRSPICARSFPQMSPTN